MLPRLIEIGPLTFYSFGLMVVLGFILAVLLAARLARLRGLPGDAFLDGAVLILFASIAGARLTYVALNWEEFVRSPAGIGAMWQGGMTSVGGIAAGILTGALYMRWKGISVLAMADAAAPALGLGTAIGRIGCLLNGCCYGTSTDLPWGIPGKFLHGADPGFHYHPAQVYDGALNALLMVLLIVAYLRPHRTGQVMALYLGGYSFFRFLVESLRKGVTADVLAFGLTEAQVFTLVMMLAAAAWWAWLQRHGRPAPPLVAKSPGEPTPEAAAGV
ncbi:MAG: prolipoprotein diacylglyceryl transferase [Armatimonadota bacterium]